VLGSGLVGPILPDTDFAVMLGCRTRSSGAGASDADTALGALAAFAASPLGQKYPQAVSVRQT
jgi:hypothetical protein